MGMFLAPFLWRNTRVYTDIAHGDFALVLLCGGAVLCGPFALVVSRVASARRRATCGDLAAVFALPVSIFVVPLGHVVLRPDTLVEAGIAPFDELLVGGVGLVGLVAAFVVLSVFVGVVAIPYDRVSDDRSWYY
ncbi:hypothetical protein L227DRAFT_581965 [Lentinus tigrinus ALCF2SS1-6]|uniref:Uncharacterized protein n=1 Tax=Lentinus tigrinus ALCF2SS1-6 TaxID=1328759 RepID=A0A5C2RQD9_9APHY|nr:hypothetical protein L227DRAFT_581965 [Lentinus tigrinus ALCF2SS1-6]